MNPFKVGDRLWYVSDRYGDPGISVQIVKVGRKYVTIEDVDRGVRFDRADIDKGAWVDTLSGRVFRSRDHFKQVKINEMADVRWARLRQVVAGMYERPAGVDVQCINAVARALKVEL